MESIKVSTDDTINWKHNNELASREKPNYSSRNTMIRREKYFHNETEGTGNIYCKELELEREGNADCMHLNA